VFIFQINAALAFGAQTTVSLVNGAQAKNVFWQVNGAGGIGAGNEFVGTLMANGAISSGEGSVVNGRLLTLTGAIAVRHAGDAAGPVGSTVSDLSDDHGPLVGPGSRDGAHTGAPRPCMERKCVAVRKCERWLCSNRPRSRVSVPQDPYRKM